MTHAILLLLAPIAGFVTALYVLLLWLGDGGNAPGYEADFSADLDAMDLTGGHVLSRGFIAMPDHLRTTDEMVGWMTKDLPKLMAEMPSLRM